MVRLGLRVNNASEYCDYRVTVYNCVQSDVIAPIGWLTLSVFVAATLVCVLSLIHIYYKKRRVTLVVQTGLLTLPGLNMIRCSSALIGLIHYSLLMSGGYGDGNYAAREFMWALCVMVGFMGSNQSSAASMVASNHINANLNLQLKTMSARTMIISSWIATLAGLPCVILAIVTGYYHDIGDDRKETIFFELSQTSLFLSALLTSIQRLAFSIRLLHQLKTRSIAGAADVELVQSKLKLQTIGFSVAVLLGLPVFCMQAYWALVFQNTGFQAFFAVSFIIIVPFLIFFLIITAFLRPIQYSKHTQSSGGHRESEVKLQSTSIQSTSDPFK